jgi:hypothetical protein
VKRLGSKIAMAACTVALLGSLAGLAASTRGSERQVPTTTTSQPRSNVPSESMTSLTDDDSATPLVHSLADVQRDEQSLTTRARQTGALHRDDMARLHRELDTLSLDEPTRLRAHRELSERLRLLSRSLATAPTMTELAELLQRIRTSHSPAERERLAAAYRVTATSLPPLRRSDALASLDDQLR